MFHLTTLENDSRGFSRRERRSITNEQIGPDEQTTTTTDFRRLLGESSTTTRKINQLQEIANGSNELLFSNQSGLVLHCPIGRDLARAIEKADRAVVQLATAAAAASTASASGSSGQFVHGQHQQAASIASSSSFNLGGQQQSQQQSNLFQPAADIQIQWEKSDTGEQLEPILYSQPTTTFHSPTYHNQQQQQITASFLYSNQQNTLNERDSSSVQPASPENSARILRQIRPDGALIIEPFRAQDFRPDVHQTSYRCIASSPARGGASLTSRDYRVRATIPIFTHAASGSVAGPAATGQQQQTTNQGGLGPVVGPEVMDELVIEGNDAQFKCQIPTTNNQLFMNGPKSQTSGPSMQYQASHQLQGGGPHIQSSHLFQQQPTASLSEDLYQVLDWIEYPSETIYSVQSTTLNYATKLWPSKGSPLSSNNKLSQLQQQQQLIDALRYFVAPQTGDLHILNVDSTLNYRSFRCRVKNRLTGEIYASQYKAKLIVTGKFRDLCSSVYVL